MKAAAQGHEDDILAASPFDGTGTHYPSLSRQTIRLLIRFLGRKREPPVASFLKLFSKTDGSIFCSTNSWMAYSKVPRFQLFLQRDGNHDHLVIIVRFEFGHYRL